MKKFYLILGLALGMLTVSCSKETTEDIVPQPKNEVVLGVTLDESSRTQIGDATETGYKVVWSEGDRLAVNEAISSEVSAESVGAQNALFTVADVTAPYHIVYPAEAVKCVASAMTSEGKVYVFSLYSPTEQEYTERSFADKVAVMSGIANDDKSSVVLKHVFSFVKVTIAKGDDVALRGVTIETLNNEPISGELSVLPLEEEPGFSGSEGLNYIHVVGKEGIPYNDAGKAEVIFAVPAGKYEGGFKVTIEDMSGKAMSRTAYATNGVELKGGEMLAMPTLTYAGEEQTGIVIRTAEQLIAFREAFKAGDYSAYLNADEEVVLGADIDMSEVTDWTSIGTTNFAGVFNGKGYKLKNWNTTAPLFTGITGTIKNVIVDESCKFTAATKAMTATGDKQCAFLAEKIHPTGVAYGCVNFGDVEAKEISNGTHRVAGLFGAGYGFIKNCKNYGDIYVTNNENMPNNLMVGGVVAYFNTNSNPQTAYGKDFLVDCSNYGNITIEFPDNVQPKNVYAGGVLGTTTYHKSSAAVNHGDIVNCMNCGDVKYSFKKLAGGTYGNIAGVVGYAEADVVGCQNYGYVEYTVPVGERTAGGTRPGVAGVVATALYSVHYCDNFGEVYVEGVWAGGTDDNAGAGAYAGAVFGGVVGVAGLYNVTETTDSVSNCTNYGKMTTKFYCLATGGTATSQGGVVGYSQMPVNDCSNEGVVNINTYCKNTYVGGVIGNAPFNVTGCSNNGSVALNLMGMTAASANFRAGGVVGYCTKTISDCHNTGNVTTGCKGLNVTGTTIYSASVVADGYVIENCSSSGSNVTNIETDSAYGTLYTAGVIGYARTSVSGCTLSGSHTLNSDDAQASVRCAGIVGQIITRAGEDAVISNCSTTETATVTLSTSNSKANYTGGIIALCNNGVDGCTNNATISVKLNKQMTGTSITYVGGVAGLQKVTINDCHNKGNIAVDLCESTAPFYAGTVLGHNYSANAVAQNLSNSGTMTITNAGNTDNIHAMVGVNDGAINEETLTNTGKVVVNGTEL